MPEAERLSPALREFVESMGVYFERYGLPRIGGRILGLLMVADRPLSLDDLASALHVSRASISTNMRLITASSLAEQISLPGDRRDYYRFGPDTWERSLRTELDGIAMLRRLGERGLAAARASESTAREHLEELLEFCDLLIEDRTKTVARWQALTESKRTGNVISPDGAGVHKRA
jgi:DNA-binding transcriptional regulator GbsR (MarR family)